MRPTEALNLLSNMAAERVQDARRDGHGLTAELIEMNRRAAIDVLLPLTKPSEESKA